MGEGPPLFLLPPSPLEVTTEVGAVEAEYVVRGVSSDPIPPPTPTPVPRLPLLVLPWPLPLASSETVVIALETLPLLVDPEPASENAILEGAPCSLASALP